jgi:hypothetical protein
MMGTCENMVTIRPITGRNPAAKNMARETLAAKAGVVPGLLVKRLIFAASSAGLLVAGCERQQRDMTGLFNGIRQLTLMTGAATAGAAGDNLAFLCGEQTQGARIFVINGHG